MCTDEIYDAFHASQLEMYSWSIIFIRHRFIDPSNWSEVMNISFLQFGTEMIKANIIGIASFN